jgi:hypothetical protein
MLSNSRHAKMATNNDINQHCNNNTITLHHLHVCSKHRFGFFVRARVALCAGLDHTVCMMKDGSAMSFGKGSDGRLGHGDEQDQPSPKTIAGLGTDALSCSAGKLHTAWVWQAWCDQDLMAVSAVWFIPCH